MQSKYTGMIIGGIFIVSIGFICFYAYCHRAVIKPLPQAQDSVPAPEIEEISHAPEQGKIISAVSLGQTEEKTVTTEAVPEISETAVPVLVDPVSEEERINVKLRVDPEELKFTVEEGRSSQAVFVIFNEGNDKVLLNIYKTASRHDFQRLNNEDIDNFLEHKQNILLQEGTNDDIRNAALFSGAAWLKQFPYWLSIGSQRQEPVTVTIVAKDLPPGTYWTDLVVLGKDITERVVVPVSVEVVAAPQIKFVKLEVDDGFSAGTRGNSNKAANPGEEVAFAVYLENRGQSPGMDLICEVSSDDAGLQFLNNQVQLLPYISEKGQVIVYFKAKILEDAHLEIPPVIILTIKDKQGNVWEENFYLGEEGNFPYPTGGLIEEKNESEIAGDEHTRSLSEERQQ